MATFRPRSRNGLITPDHLTIVGENLVMLIDDPTYGGQLVMLGEDGLEFYGITAIVILKQEFTEKFGPMIIGCTSLQMMLTSA